MSLDTFFAKVLWKYFPFNPIKTSQEISVDSHNHFTTTHHVVLSPIMRKVHECQKGLHKFMQAGAHSIF